jgi:hypothetical protein
MGLSALFASKANLQFERDHYRRELEEALDRIADLEAENRSEIERNRRREDSLVDRLVEIANPQALPVSSRQPRATTDLEEKPPDPDAEFEERVAMRVEEFVHEALLTGHEYTEQERRDLEAHIRSSPTEYNV